MTLSVGTEVARSVATIETLVERCGNDRSRHMGAVPDGEEDLKRIEEQLGLPLPAPFRLFLRRMGGGVYYLRHEIFGARRVMIHDIELLPDVLSFRRRFDLLPAELPMHQAGAVVHVLDLRSGQVRRTTGGIAYPDFASFLEAVVVPAEG